MFGISVRNDNDGMNWRGGRFGVPNQPPLPFIESFFFLTDIPNIDFPSVAVMQF